MKTQDLKNAILHRVQSEEVINLVMRLRDESSNEFIRSLCWTVISGAKRFGTAKISEKQAFFIAKEVCTFPACANVYGMGARLIEIMNHELA